ncbi:hypothetical protein HY408_02080 [Candidatus Gottesmanbacteria bacterium]|nr:hypothetical protein [Candidatus Gottesmanbacteria bacterium]
MNTSRTMTAGEGSGPHDQPSRRNYNWQTCTIEENGHEIIVTYPERE